MMLIKCTSALRSAQKSSCSFPAHFVLTNAPQSRATRGFFSAASVRGDVLSSCSFDEQAEANEQALSFDQQAKSKSNDKSKSTSKSNNKITNAHSADADEGSLSAACSADAEPKREKSSAKKQSVSKKMEEHFRELWLLYPLKRGKNQVKAAAKRRLAFRGIKALATCAALFRQVRQKHFFLHRPESLCCLSDKKINCQPCTERKRHYKGKIEQKVFHSQYDF